MIMNFLEKEKKIQNILAGAGAGQKARNDYSGAALFQVGSGYGIRIYMGFLLRWHQRASVFIWSF